MADGPPKTLQRRDPRGQTRRDLERLGRRKPQDRFWRSVALLGSVGWPIALLGAGGALLGRFFDNRWGTGVRLTLTLLTLGVTAGTISAYRSLRKED